MEISIVVDADDVAVVVVVVVVAAAAAAAAEWEIRMWQLATVGTNLSRSRNREAQNPSEIPKPKVYFVVGVAAFSLRDE